MTPDEQDRSGDGEGGPPEQSASTDEKGRRGTRRRVAQTKDDTDAGWGEWADEDAHERWLREQRPPHWE